MMVTIVFMRIIGWLINMKQVHWYYKFLVLFLIFFSMFFLFNKNISNFVNNSSYKYYVNSVFAPFSSVSRNSIINCKDAISKNNYFQKKVLDNSSLEEINKSLTEEIETLKKTMKLKNTYTGYKTVYAKTTNRNRMYWYSTITIDKGSKDGVKKNDAVVGIDGLIGIVKDTTKGSSTVKLITNSDANYKVSGIIKKDNLTIVGLIEGYEYPYLKVSLATNDKDVKVGDKFYSSGLSSFPKNIYIGTVRRIEKGGYDLENILYVEPKQDMNDINYVVVLNNK